MDNNDNLDRFLDRMAKQKRKLNPGNHLRDNRSPKAQGLKPTQNQRNANQKDEQKKYLPKESQKPEGKKKYIAKETLQKNESNRSDIFGQSRYKQDYDDLQETKSPQPMPKSPQVMPRGARQRQGPNIRNVQENNYTQARSPRLKQQDWLDMLEDKKQEGPKEFNRRDKEFKEQKNHNKNKEPYKNYKQPNKEPYKNNKQPYKNYKQPKTFQYKNQCQRYLINCEKLQEREQELGIQIKKLKRFFLESELIRSNPTKPSDISIMKCLDSPVLFIQYNYQGETRYMILRDLCKGLGDKKKLGDFCQIIKKIYEMHYFPVDIQYEKALLEFVKLKAQSINHNLALNKQRNLPTHFKQTQKMFYYSLSKQNYVELIFFDYMVRSITVTDNYINKNKKNVDEQTFNTFQKFMKNAQSKQDLEVVNLGEEEVESQHEKTNDENQEENPKQIALQCQKMKRRLQQLLLTDISEIQEDLERKNQLHLDMIDNEPTKIKQIQSLGDEIDKINRILQNFKSVKFDIDQKLRQVKFTKVYTISDLDFMKLSLKRMVFAKKQLDSDLPILGKKKQIFDLLDRNNLIILEGQTGSGKSTQLPQMLCEYYKLFQNPNALPVLVTQPRKIATRSLAERVAEELQEKGGTFVDYVASGAKNANPKAKIIFKLDRLVLDELVESPTLEEYSCLVIDQAHERTISIDVILGLVKQLLKKRDGFKVIITSASMEIALFERYFKQRTLKVSGRMFPVTIKYLPSKEEDMIKKIEKAIDNQLLTQRNMLKDKYKGHILVFCADTAEIESLSDIFKRKLNHNVFMVIPLHGKLSPEDQKKAFSKTKEHKLIFASRIAETAITIDGVKVVIDPGLDREMQYDQKTKFSSMKLVQISQSSAKQRAGRAGRTQEGYCLRLYSESDFKKRRFNKLPEIKNIALQTLVLRLKTLGINNVSSFDYIEKPDEQGMKTSIETLKMIGCLDFKENITSIGKFLVRIPIQPFLARSIIQGLLMQSVINKSKTKNAEKVQLAQSIIEILCMVLSAGNLFRIQENYRQMAQKMKYTQFSHEKGDFFFLKNIYDQFKAINEYNRNQLKDWLSDHFLIRKTLIQVKDLVREILSILKQFQIDERQMKDDLLKCKIKIQKYDKNEDRILSCLTTSFAANLCLFSGHPQIGYTYMSMEKLVTIYGTSCLSLLGVCPKWILAYDFYENKDGKLYCKVANQIDYQFMKNTVQDYVYQKYEIDRLHTCNPFYKSVSYDLETLTMLQLKEYYQRRDYLKEKQLQFIKTLNLIFSQTQNKATAFIKCDKNEEYTKQTIENNLQKFIEHLRMKTISNYNHNYIGNIFVLMGNGFQILKIDFKSSQTVFQISGLDQETLNTIQNDWERVATNVQTYGTNKLKLYFDNQQLIVSFNLYIEFYKEKEDKKLIVKTQIADIRKKVPQTKIYLHWFAGQSQKDNVLIKFAYETNRNNDIVLSQKQVQEITQKHYEYLIQAKQDMAQKKHKSRQINPIQRRQMLLGLIDFVEPTVFTQKDKQLLRQSKKINGIRLTNKRNGITIFSQDLDQIDLARYFTGLISTNNINPAFQMPKSIKKFRDPQRPFCEWKDNKWIEEIQKMLQSVTDKNEPCIRVWGYGLIPKGKQKLSQLEKSWRIDMKAQIKTFDYNLLQKLKNEYDGKKQILGCQKLHVSSLFSQSVVPVQLKAFENMKDEFNYNIDNFKLEYPDLIFDHYIRQNFRNAKKSRVYITISCQNRQHLLKPIRVLNALFTPKHIAMLDSEYRYLFYNQGANMLYDIQTAFDQKIYFGFDRNQRRIKLYCEDSLQNDVKAMLKRQLSSINYHDEIVSYKGKNLKLVEQILKQKIDQIADYNSKSRDQKFLSYEIKFTTRNIKIMADIGTFYEIKVSINNLQVKKGQNECPVCYCAMITPYRLFNCKHSFCWSCLENDIKEFKLGTSTQLKCSFVDQNDQTCNQFINIYDVMKILSEQELQQIFDAKISKYVDEHLDKYIRCYSPDCEQIFELESLNNDKEIDCRLCGKYYCLDCKQPHKNYTCKQWKVRNDFTGKIMEEIGVKQCPKCKTGIQKNGGCKHISCSCGAHICWECLKIFTTGQQCYDHLAKDHDGIFGANYVAD